MTDKKLKKLEEKNSITIFKNDDNSYHLLRGYKSVSIKIKNEMLGCSVQLLTELSSPNKNEEKVLCIKIISFLTFEPDRDNIHYLDIVDFDGLKIKLEETSNIDSIELEIKYLIN